MLAVVVMIAVPAVCGISAPVQSASAAPLGNKEPGKSETAVGDLVADSFRNAMGSDIAFVAASDLKPIEIPLTSSKIGAEAIITLLGYPEDTLAVLSLDGSAIRQALERSVSAYPRSNLGYLQVSGIKFTFNPGKEIGSRITSITIGDQSVSDNQKYTVAVLNSLANGALGYWKVWSAANIVPSTQKETASQALESYFQANSKLDYGTLTRISTVK